MSDSIAKIVAEMRELSRTDAGASEFGARRMKEWADRLAALDGWRPMAEAPKDGTLVMFSVLGSPKPIMCRADDYWAGRNMTTNRGTADWLDEARGWKPIPAPPKETP